MHYSNALTVSCCLLHASFLSLVACLSPANIEELLSIHNFYRRVIASSYPPYSVSNMNKLVWSNTLAFEAAQTVTCLSWRQRNSTDSNDFARSNNVGRRRHVPGVLTQIIRRWYQERSRFIPNAASCLPWNSCNHFRNLVNAKHRRMGCAAAMSCGRNRNILVLMCLYEGGITEEFGFQYGTPCTGCDATSPFCQINLCVSCNSSIDQCVCRKNCSREGIGYGVLNSQDCTCNCAYGHGPNCDRPCRNPQPLDFDVCTLISRADCDDPINGPDYREFCPAVCSCRPLPSSYTNMTNNSNVTPTS